MHTSTPHNTAEILRLKGGQQYGSLTVATRHWPNGVWLPAMADQIAQGADADELLGTPGAVTLTGDGTPYWSAWCRCPAVADDHWIRYERWSARGLEGHGYAHKMCRAILQTG